MAEPEDWGRRGRLPFGPAEVDAMRGAPSISTRRAYGVQRICRVWERARSSVYARRHATKSRALRCRRGPVGAAPDAVRVGHLRRVLQTSPFHGEGYRKAWAKLRVAGIRTSKERVRRVMREHDLQAPHRVGHAHGPKAHDGTITTEAPDAMWGTDMTATVTLGEGSAFVFVAVDHCTTECIGLHAATSLTLASPRTCAFLKAGVLEDGRLRRSTLGTPQGGVVSPLLANIYLHHVLDAWFTTEVQPRLRGRSVLVRYADEAPPVFLDTD